MTGPAQLPRETPTPRSTTRARVQVQQAGALRAAPVCLSVNHPPPTTTPCGARGGEGSVPPPTGLPGGRRWPRIWWRFEASLGCISVETCLFHGLPSSDVPGIDALRGVGRVPSRGVGFLRACLRAEIPSLPGGGWPLSTEPIGVAWTGLAKAKRRKEGQVWKKKRKEAYSTRYSQAVSHPSTNQARPCLASEIRRDRARSGWYGRRRGRTAPRRPKSRPAACLPAACLLPADARARRTARPPARRLAHTAHRP